MLAIGHRLQNRYQIEKILGAGGFGVVYLALDSRLNHRVAVKAMSVDHQAASQQFEHEAHLLAQLKHLNLPKVTDHFIESKGSSKGQYLVMEYIPGKNLHDMLAQHGAMSETQALTIMLPVLHALVYLHEQKPPVFHRDIKPGNIRITPKNEVYLVDFGLAKVSVDNNMTMIGARGHTNGYSPIEQYGFGGTDARTDLYAVGATLYSLVTRQIPLDAPRRANKDHLIPIRKFQHVSSDFERVVYKLLALSPDDRYQSARAVIEELQYPDAGPARLTGKKGQLDEGHSKIYDNPLKSPMRALTDTATVVAGVAMGLPWLEWDGIPWGFPELLTIPYLGYTYECLISIGAILALVCLMFVKKRVAATRTALARWKLLLALALSLPALDIVLTELIAPAAKFSLIGAWIILGASLAIALGSVGDIQSWWLPQAAREAGRARLIRGLHFGTVVIIALAGVLTMAKDVISDDSYQVSALMTLIVLIGTFASFNLPDGLIRPDR